ncbi:MAG TPA: hypothetical protein VEO91_10985 [Candidatus Limnocylindria bacterium]|nr:hypothetical protein [Candidatus Limnocylindria bacterium]
MAITVSAIAIPGKNAHHQLPRMSAFCALDSALPQLVWSAPIPKFRQLTNASRTMFEPMSSVIATMTGPRPATAMGRPLRRLPRADTKSEPEVGLAGVGHVDDELASTR